MKLKRTTPVGTAWAGNHVHALRHLWNSPLGEQKALHRVRGPERCPRGVRRDGKCGGNPLQKPALFQGSSAKKGSSAEITWNHLEETRVPCCKSTIWCQLLGLASRSGPGRKASFAAGSSPKGSLASRGPSAPWCPAVLGPKNQHGYVIGTWMKMLINELDLGVPIL